MPSGRRWHFQVRESEINLIRDGEEMESVCGLKYGAIKDITTGKDKKSSGDKDQMVLILFAEGKKGYVSRKNFEWNKNDFCKKFKNTTTATDFVEVWKRSTDFNVVLHCAYPIEPESDNADTQTCSSINESIHDEILLATKSVHENISPHADTPTRKRSAETSLILAPKKTKIAMTPTDECIEAKKIGLIELSIKNMDKPHHSRLLRKVDPVFIESLIKRLKSDPNGPGIPPLAVSCKSVAKKELFKRTMKDIYRYEVHGGLHGVKARQSLLTENPSLTELATIHAIVYVGLSDEEALRLAARHNINGHYNHRMTHRDYLEACRARLFAMSDQETEAEPPQPTPDWKKACVKYILPLDISRTQKENIFTQASFKKRVWESAMKVMNAYEMGELKDQKLNRKQMISTPEFKQHLLQPLHNLPEDFQMEILEQVANNSISLTDMKASAANFRSIEIVKKTFVRVTKAKNWEEACITFPEFAKEARLQQFVALNFKHGPPQVFQNYCDAAMAGKSTLPGIGVPVTSGSSVVVVCSDFNAVTAQDIQSIDHTYTGAHLIMASIPNECTQEDADSIVYTGRQINSLSAAVQFFNVIMFCRLDQIEMVMSSAKKCYDNVELAYIHNQDTPPRPSEKLCLTPALAGIVIGHWSHDGEFHPKDYCNSIGHHNVFVTSAKESLLRDIITTFSFDGQTVIDAVTESNGVIAAKLGRKTYKISSDCSLPEKIGRENSISS